MLKLFLSTGQIVFALISIVVFAIIIFFSYKGDKKLHRKYYKNNFWVFVIFLIFILLLVGVKIFLSK